MKKVLLTLLLSLLIPFAAVAQEAYAVYNNGTLTFYYDNLRSSRTGTTYDLNKPGIKVPDWDVVRLEIQKAVIDPLFINARPTTTYHWFAVGYNEKSILKEIEGLEYLNTSQVTDMGAMFYGCSELNSIDVSHFDTSKCTYFNSMFYNCKNVTNIDVSSFNTNKAIYMSFMFSGCSSLTNLDVSHFDTKNIRDMTGMFEGCNSLKSVDVSNFDTNNCSKMTQMFYGCANLTELDVSNFNTSKVESMKYMFRNCYNLKKLDVSNFNTENVTDMSSMFSGCNSLSYIDVNNFDTSKVTDMGSMFQGCNSVSVLDVSHFKTNNVTGMNSMFERCNSLSVLDIANFSTNKVDNMSWMFAQCTNLKTIYVGESWSTSNVKHFTGMFGNCTNLVGGAGTKYDVDHIDVAYAHIDGGPSNPGYLTDKNATPQTLEAYAVYTDDGTLTFYYDNQKSSRSGTIYGMNTGSSDPGWHTDHRQEIKKAVFDSSFAKASPTSTYRWFAIQNYPETSILTEIVGIEHLNTSAVVNMAYMFWRCSGLTSLDVTHFDTSKVTNMNRMFSYCSGLTGLDVTHFDTSKVRQMNSMFMGCSGLTSLDLSHFDTSNVVDMHYMFSYCSGLTSLDVTHFNTNKVIGMSTMFNDCSGLTSLDVSNFNTINVTDMNGIFGGCSGLKSLDVSNFNTSKVTNMGGMFYGCSSLTSLDVTHFDTSKASDMGGMFSDCSGLTSLDVSHFDTSNVTSMGGMFSNCSGLTSLDVSHFDTSKASDMGGMFSGCSGLTSLDLSHFDTSNVTTMGYSWGESLFQDCTNLTTIYVGDGWNTDNVKDSGNMFLNCINLVGGMGTKYDANHVGIEYAHIDGGASNPGYLTGKNVQAPVSDSDDLQDFINSLGDNKGTEDDPVDVPVDPNGLTIDNDVDIVDDLQLAINGNDTENKVHVCFWSGFFNIGQNSGLSFKNVTFASKDVAAAMQQRAAGNGSGIKNSGTLKFANCTFLPGEYTMENSSNTYIGEGVTGCRLINKTGGRINISSPLTDDLTIAVPTEADVEPDVVIITGVSDTDHILMSLPSGYAYKYDAIAGGIVVYSTTGITAVGQQTTVKYSYDTTGRKVDNNRKGLHIQRMSDGKVRKVMTNN